MNTPRLKRRSSATEMALQKFVSRQQIESGNGQPVSHAPIQSSPPEKKLDSHQGSCFLYTSAHCSDLKKLEEQANNLQTIEWRDLDIRQPRFQKNEPLEDGWEEVDFFNN